MIGCGGLGGFHLLSPGASTPGLNLVLTIAMMSSLAFTANYFSLIGIPS